MGELVFSKMKYRSFFMFMFLTSRAHPFAKLWDEIEEWPEKFERRSSSIQSKVNENYPINLLDQTAQVSMKDLFELDMVYFKRLCLMQQLMDFLSR